MILLLLFPLAASTSIAAPLSPRQLVLPGAGGTNYWWPAAAASTLTSTYASSVLPSSTASSSSSSSSSSPLLPSSAAALEKPFNFLYLIPLFAVVGLSILIAIGWLIHGCCTRKPKSRPLLPQHMSFKAFRYEDINNTQPLHDQNDGPCQHVKEYGFQCDCRLQDSFDGKLMEKEKEEEDGGYLDIQLQEENTNNTPGFRMVDDDCISSSSPLSQLSTKIKLDSSTLSSSSNGSWMGKVVHALGSRFSSTSGKDEDRYTAIPGPLNSSPRKRTNKLVKKRKEKKSSNRVRLSSDQLSTTTTTTAAEEETISSQKRRLQNHRDSIASLPAGMVFSPPSVGFSVFGEEDRFTTVITVRDKLSPPRVLGRL